MIGERIKLLRGEETQAAFAARFGITRNTIRRYESGGNYPDTGFVAALCEEYNVNAHWLITGEGPKHLHSNSNSASVGAASQQNKTNALNHHTQIPNWQDPEPDLFHYVPMAKAQLSAGGGSFILSEDFVGYYAFRKDWLKRIATATDRVVLMTVQGNSMSPTIRDKDTVMIDTGRTNIIEGQIYALRLEDTIMLKRLTQRPGGIIKVISDNKEEFETYQANRTDLYIIGQIIFFCRDLVAY